MINSIFGCILCSSYYCIHCWSEVITYLTCNLKGHKNRNIWLIHIILKYVDTIVVVDTNALYIKYARQAPMRAVTFWLMKYEVSYYTWWLVSLMSAYCVQYEQISWLTNLTGNDVAWQSYLGWPAGNRITHKGISHIFTINQCFNCSNKTTESTGSCTIYNYVNALL